jgi:hypothetical protein
VPAPKHCAAPESSPLLPRRLIAARRAAPRRAAGPEALRTIDIKGDPFFSFHHVNAFEAGPGGRHVVVDTCAMPRVDFSNSTDNLQVCVGGGGGGRGGGAAGYMLAGGQGSDRWLACNIDQEQSF